MDEERTINIEDGSQEEEQQNASQASENVNEETANEHAQVDETAAEPEKEQEQEEKDEKEHWIRKERYTGAARRSFFVGKHVEEEDVKAKYENGILTIEVPKAEAKQPKPEEKKYIAIEG